MTKQEKIREAYAEHWEKVKGYVDEDGWCHFKDLYGDFGNSKDLTGIDLSVKNPYDPYQCYYKRPISISGIDNNNHWVKIESLDSFPKEEIFCITCIYLEGTAYQINPSARNRKPEDLLRMWQSAELTHYKIIENNPPVY